MLLTAVNLYGDKVSSKTITRIWCLTLKNLMSCSHLQQKNTAWASFSWESCKLSASDADFESPETSLQTWEGTRRILEAIQVTKTLCTHSYNIKRMCKPYSCAPFTKVSCSTAVTQCGSDAGPRTLAKPSYILYQAKLTDSRGSEILEKGAIILLRQPSDHSFWSPRESDETNHQPQDVEWMGDTAILQKGGHGDT